MAVGGLVEGAEHLGESGEGRRAVIVHCGGWMQNARGWFLRWLFWFAMSGTGHCKLRVRMREL